MQFIIKQISPSRKEVRIAIDSTYVDGSDQYIFGSVDGHFDNGTIDPKYIPPTKGFTQNSVFRSANFDYSRKILNFIKNELIGGDDKFEYLFEKGGFYSPIVNVTVDKFNTGIESWNHTGLVEWTGRSFPGGRDWTAKKITWKGPTQRLEDVPIGHILNVDGDLVGYKGIAKIQQDGGDRLRADLFDATGEFSYYNQFDEVLNPTTSAVWGWSSNNPPNLPDTLFNIEKGKSYIVRFNTDIVWEYLLSVPTFLIKLLNPLPSNIAKLDRINLIKQILFTQEQNIYYIPETPPLIEKISLPYDVNIVEEIGNPDTPNLKYENYNKLTGSFDDITTIHDIDLEVILI
tara:strand:- start:743 stop:1777 length:1035 start_codon:yes stop_codon:yes gene_type:complete